MPEVYQNRRIGNHWSGAHTSQGVALALFDHRWRDIEGPWQLTKPDGGWTNDIFERKEVRRRIAEGMANNPEIGFRIRVRGTPPSQDQYVLRRFFQSEGNDILDTALSQLGVQYVWADADPKDGATSGFDCSGLVMWVMAQFGYVLPHQSEQQRLLTTPTSWADARPGELVFYGEGGAPVGPAAHVGFKFDDTRILDTASREHPVAVRGVGDVWIGKGPFVCGYFPGLTRPK